MGGNKSKRSLHVISRPNIVNTKFLSMPHNSIRENRGDQGNDLDCRGLIMSNERENGIKVPFMVVPINKSIHRELLLMWGRGGSDLRVVWNPSVRPN